MGGCGSTELTEHDQGGGKSREVTAGLARDEEEAMNIHKLLLLGPGNSGKSTFFKQIVDLHGGGWDEKAKASFKANIHDSIIEQMQMLLVLVRDEFVVDLREPVSQYKGIEEMRRIADDINGDSDGDYGEEEKAGGSPVGGDGEASAAEDAVVSAASSSDDGSGGKAESHYEATYEELERAQTLVDQADYLEDLPKDAKFNSRIAQAIEVVWSDRRVKDVFECRGQIGVADSCPYFFNNIHRFAKDSYSPTMDDILYARNSTVGIRHKSFKVDHDRFEIFDVGGQRNERSKWLHIFDNVRAVLFVTSLSCYDQKLFEDSTTNAMEESLDLWDEICNSPYFTSDITSLVIFFNKKDLFEKKLVIKPLTIAFPEYDGPSEFKPAYEYIMRIFEDKQQLFDQRTIYCHATQATDKNNVKRVLYDVTHNAVVTALHANGIM